MESGSGIEHNTAAVGIDGLRGKVAHRPETLGQCVCLETTTLRLNGYVFETGLSLAPADAASPTL